jgi:dienelactone hydrolase
MRSPFARHALALLAVTFAAIAPVRAYGAGNPEWVEIQQKDGARLKAALFRPEGSGPFQTVIGLHNCTGLSNRNGVMGARYRDWAQHLAKANFAVLLPDSHSSRGLGSQCGPRRQLLRVERERVADIEAARGWLQKQSWVVADRISLVGWSNGGIAALWAVRTRAQPGDGPDYRSAVAFYPGCRRLGTTAWSARVPTLILIGRADDQASAHACQQMVTGARGRSAKVDLHVYAGAHHDFDHPNRPVQVRTGLAFSADGSGRGHSGTDPAARADALKRVPEFLAR